MIHHEDTEDTKKKGKPVMRGWRFIQWITGFLLVGILIIIALAILGPIINGQIRTTTLSTEYMSLATSLLGDSSTTTIDLEGVSLELAVSYVGDTWINYVCVYTSPATLMMEDYSNSRLFVNGTWVIGARSQNYGARGLRLPAIKPWCGWGELETGVHLIEFELRDSIFGEPIYTHQWAIEVER